MNANKPPMPGGFDADDAPDLSEMPWREKFEAVAVRRGRPKSDAPKISTTLRLDPDVLEHFRKSGSGWQSRINAVLREAIRSGKV